MEEVIKYFESLEARLAENEKRIAALEEALQTNEAVIASMEAEIEELKNRPAAEPEIPEMPESPKVPDMPETPAMPETPETQEKPKTPAPEPEPVVEEQASPKAAVYGKPVDDIRQAISLGDRFLYQRELFGQNAELMQRTLTEINNLKSFDEAMSYIGSRFQWDTESNSYQQFIVSLHRRFG